ncbi:MAG: acetate/propionate family kinase [Thermoleophilia bacterium]|nr:acetate/propionate family kinase [Thermoleophilia bacterium]
MGLAGLTRVLVVNAGSETLKLSLVGDAEAQAVDRFVDADAVGHRVVHGGERFREPVLVDDDVVAAIEALVPLAPLHNAPALRGLREARAALPDVPHVAVFDTAFHATIPDEAAVYAVPQTWGIRRYGFHGIAVRWAAEQVPVPRLVVCHLGGGSSVTAVRDGRSVDTTMGFTPLEGVPMQTRSGSVDPGALLYVQRELGLSVDELEQALNRESGLAALGGLDSPLGFAVYVYRVAQAVAAMAAALDGVDANAFSGGIGENRADVRAAVRERVAFLGLDEARVRVVAAREDVVIAREVGRLLGDPH